MDCIFYFSGTGNSQAVAKRLSQALCCQTRAITRELLDAGEPVKCGRGAVIFPSYAYGLPQLVREFLKTYPFECGYLALAVTCGTKAGGSLASAKSLLKRRGMSADYFATIRTVENYLPLFGAGDPELTRDRIAEQSAHCGELIRAMEGLQKNDIVGFRPLSAAVSGLFRFATPLLAKSIKVSERCSGCGVCARVCPAKAIALGASKTPEVDGRRCNQCQGCLNVCPEHALSMWRFDESCPNYLHPEVKVSELIRR